MSKMGDTVTSVGSAWIICRSKSHAGRIYYFNTLTGEAAWNLSEAEVEKAKTQTKIYESQSGIKIHNRPEPLEPPKEHTNKDMSFKIVTPRVYNKQIINNQFTKTQNPQPIQYPQCNSINPVQFSVPIASAFTPGVWNVIPQHIIVAPMTTPPQPSLNNRFFPLSNTSETFTNQFPKSIVSNTNKTVLNKEKNFRRKYTNKCNKYKQCSSTDINNFKSMKNNLDLRFLLSSKRSISKNNLSRYPDSNYEESVHSKGKQIPGENNDNNQNIAERNNCLDVAGEVDDLMEDDLELDANAKVSHVEHLRTFFELNGKFEVWYIVTDSNVLLHHMSILKLILKLDTQCRLLVPRSIMDQIQNATKSRFRTEAHRAAYFICQQVDAKLAIIDEAIGENVADKHEIINCCIKLKDHGDPVILLTDDIELHNHENSSCLPIFTIMEIKRFLCNEKIGESNKTSNSNAVDHSQSIQITINNDSKTQLHEVSDKQLVSVPIFDRYIKNNEEQEKATRQLIDAAEKDKETFDKEVQVKTSNGTLSKPSESKRYVTVPPQENEKSNDVISAPVKSKKIKLRRTTSHNTTSANYLDKKKLNWHRHKTKSNVSTVDSQQKDDDSTTIVTRETRVDSMNMETAPRDSDNLHLVLPAHAPIVPRHKHNPHSNEDGQTDSVTFRNLNTRDIYLEETSNSDTSNAFSYIDTESVRSQVSKTRFDRRNEYDDDNNVMFEVSSREMECYLRMECEKCVCSFVRIMEEALNRVLLQEPQLVVPGMSPPWTMHEAIECVKIKFHNDPDVADATGKLSRVSIENGGLRGKITSDMSPTKYMEMYSFGVYLIDALQGLLTNNEYLRIAAESLSKLLNVIQDSPLNTNIDDSSDVTHDDKVNDADARTDSENNTKYLLPRDVESNTENHKENKKTSPKATIIKGPATSPASYNLRSLRRKEKIDRGPREDTYIGRVDKSSFLTSLNLQKNSNTHDPDENDTPVSINPSTDNCGDEPSDRISDEDSPNTLENIVSENQTQSKCEPKIVMTFTKCPEFEERLQRRSLEPRRAPDSWTRRNENSVHDSYEEYDFENQYYLDDYFSHDDYIEDDNQEFEIVNPRSVNSFVEKLDNLKQDDKVTFESVMGTLEKSIKSTFLMVQDFCSTSHNKLSSQNNETIDKNEIQELSEKMYMYVKNICDVLNSIITRESSDSANKLCKLLDSKEFENIIVNDGDLDNYINFIDNCLKQGNNLKETLTLVIQASKE